ncbi:DUF4430 domain-containing protein [Aceticella autotrophica]|uniref:DUF4430 domain-containing protein n=1 Tax=Aceticella autotrophica TaxID=2755338 RepID=A0A975AVN4_9THEO|nr:DUF4430 domain-containing protein [Aceticella autotrophica]QSZ27301.1 DUF4430 domain-containing protein [Aceticella autotrophica]
MKQKLTYLAIFLIIIAAVAVPALYMNKVFHPQQQYKQSEESKANNNLKNNKGQSAANANQTNDNQKASSSENNSQPSTNPLETNTDNKTQTAANANQQAAASTSSTSSSNNATPTTPENGCRVWIAIVGKNGEFLFKPQQVVVKQDNKWGITALGALDATGLPYIGKPTWPDFIDSIAGQANSGVEGWMYSVNGEVPNHMADKHPVKTGDKIIWWYSKSMDQPPPSWDSLLHKQ